MELTEENIQSIIDSTVRLSNSGSTFGTHEGRTDNDFGGTGTVFQHEGSNYITSAAHVILDSETNLPNGINIDGGMYYFLRHGQGGFNVAVAKLISYNADGVCTPENVINFETLSGNDSAVLKVLDPVEDFELMDKILRADTRNESVYETRRLVDVDGNQGFVQSFEYEGAAIPLEESITIQEGEPQSYLFYGFPGHATENNGLGSQISLVESYGFAETQTISSNGYQILTPAEGVDNPASGHSGSAVFVINKNGEINPAAIVVATSDELGLGYAIPIAPSFEIIRKHAELASQEVELSVTDKTPSCHLAGGDLHSTIDETGFPSPVPRPN